MGYLEQVISGLRCLNTSTPEDCVRACGEAYRCRKAVTGDALELLETTKAGRPVSRPYVLTVKEIRNLPRGEMESVPVVIESKIPVGEWNRGTIIKWVSSAFAVEQYRDSLRKKPYEWYTYGKTMRFWSSMPTMKQREAVKWDE